MHVMKFKGDEKMKKEWVALVSTAFLLATTGCAGNQDDQAANTDRNTHVNRVSYNQQNNQASENKRDLRLQARAVNNIERLDEVEKAQVIMRNNDAYVAIRLSNENNRDTTGDKTNANDTTDVNADKTRTGMNQTNGTTVGHNRGRDREGLGNNTTNINTDIRTDERSDLQNNINRTPAGNNPTTSRPGLGNNTNFTGTVIGSDTNNRYARNVSDSNGTEAGNEYSEVSTRLEQKIADQVRAADKNVHEVFVSVNTDFYDQMTNYTDDIRNDQNRDGLFDDFTDTVRYFFDR